ncbi:MAG TPA: pseudouridine synthase [Candidatus Saccharimonadales bacterium]
MRLNRFISLATGISRRQADREIEFRRVSVDGHPAENGQQVDNSNLVTLNDKPLTIPQELTTIMLNKPVGYVVSRNGQGSQTVYELLPEKYSSLKPVGRLDKYSSGLLLLTDDGQLSQLLTHPGNKKTKIYELTLDHQISEQDRRTITTLGVKLDDGLSKLKLNNIDQSGRELQVIMSEGRNRQIRRTFSTLGYDTLKLHRTDFGDYKLGDLRSGSFERV